MVLTNWTGWGWPTWTWPLTARSPCPGAPPWGPPQALSTACPARPWPPAWAAARWVTLIVEETSYNSSEGCRNSSMICLKNVIPCPKYQLLNLLFRFHLGPTWRCCHNPLTRTRAQAGAGPRPRATLSAITTRLLLFFWFFFIFFAFIFSSPGAVSALHQPLSIKARQGETLHFNIWKKQTLSSELDGGKG